MSADLQSRIKALSKLGEELYELKSNWQAVIHQACAENSWFTIESYSLACKNWSVLLTTNSLESFASIYNYASSAKTVGIVMAGNIPMVGFHDLLCVCLVGHKAKVKLSSNDKVFMQHIISMLCQIDVSFKDLIQVDTKISDVDAVIATGSNNSFRYFQYYFKNIPNLLRKNRKSIAVLTGNETTEELKALGKDVFTYFGLGCRNVALILLPKSQNITTVLDEWKSFENLVNHNKYANNYTYHKALFLMNQTEHLDTGYLVLKKELSLAAPLGCIYYWHYDNPQEITDFMESESENIQCTVGNYSNVQNVSFGQSQSPGLQNFADNIDTMKFLESLR